MIAHRQISVLAAVDLPQNVLDDINLILGWVAGIAAVICVTKIIFVGLRMAWDHNHTPGLETPTMAELAGALIGWVLASSAAIGMAVILIGAGRAPEASQQPDQPSIVDDIQQKYPPLEKEN